jgi:hypothetical protein
MRSELAGSSKIYLLIMAVCKKRDVHPKNRTMFNRTILRGTLPSELAK